MQSNNQQTNNDQPTYIGTLEAVADIVQFWLEDGEIDFHDFERCMKFLEDISLNPPCCSICGWGGPALMVVNPPLKNLGTFEVGLWSYCDDHKHQAMEFSRKPYIFSMPLPSAPNLLSYENPYPAML